MSRGEMLGAVQRFLFHLRPERDESGRKARVKLLDGAFGVLSMTDLADQSDGVIATGLRRLQAKAQSSGDLAAATGKPRQRERQPGEDDN